MSTKIYNGIKFKSNNIEEVLNQLHAIRKEALKICNNTVTEKDIEDYIDLLIAKIPSEKETIEDKRIEFFEKYKDYIIKNKIYKDVRAREELACLFFNVEFFVYLIPYKGHIYGGHFSLQNEYWKLLEPYVEDYHYQNQTDKPENISDAEWDERRNVWNEIFNDFLSFKDLGLRYDIVTIDDLFLFPKVKKVVEKMKNNNE